MRNALFAALVAGSTLVAPVLAQATCVKTGTIIRVVLRDAAEPGNHVIDLRVNFSDTFYYSARTGDPNTAQAAIVLNALGTPVQIIGGAATCPTTGTARLMGTARVIIASP